MHETRTIRIDRVRLSDYRPVAFEKLPALSDSMQASGLINPITVVAAVVMHGGAAVDGYRIIAGNHRVESAKRLGWTEIDAYIVEGKDTLECELMTIDENLMRSELTATQQAEHLQRRKEIWEAMRERDNSGTSCPTIPDDSERGRGRPQEFAEATAESTGTTKKNINRATRRAREVCQEARDIIRNTGADTGVFLDQLAKLDSDETQVEAAQEKVDAINDAQHRRELREEQKERERHAKEMREEARAECVNFLHEKLTAREWRYFIERLDASGGSLRASVLRDWEPA